MRDWLLIALIALCTRAVVLWGMSELPLFVQPQVDAALYHEAALRVTGGDLLLGHEAMHMSPGYFYVLGATYAVFGAGPWAFRIVQMLLGVGTVLLVWQAASRMLPRRVALMVGLCAALYEPLAFYEAAQLCESTAAFLLAAWVAFALHTLEGPSLRRLVALFALWGVLCVLRPNATSLIVPLAYVAFQVTRELRIEQRALWTSVSLAAGLLVMTPIAARNYLATGELVMLVDHLGVNLYIGNGPGATGSMRVVPELRDAHTFADVRRIVERAAGHPLTSAQMDAYWEARTLAAVRQDPIAWLRVMRKKVYLFANGRELSDIYDYSWLRGVSFPLGLPFVQFAWIAPFAWLGLFVLLRRGPKERTVLLAIVSYAAGVIAVFVNSRYRLPIVPALFLSAGACIDEIGKVVRAGLKPRLALAAACAGVAVWLVWPARFTSRGSPAAPYFELGTGYHSLGRLEQAEQTYAAALAEDPKHVPTHNNLALLYEQQHALSAARREWQRLLEVAPDQGSAEAKRARAHLAKTAAAAER